MKRTAQAMLVTLIAAGGMALGMLQASAAPEGTRVTGADTGVTSPDPREDGREDGRDQGNGDGQNW
jgi:hypothetical protein